MKIIQPNDPVIFYHNHPKALLCYAGEEGLNISELRDLTGLDETLEKDFSSKVSYNQYKSLIEVCIDKLNNPALGLHFGKRLMFSGHGSVGLGSMACNTIGEALDIIKTYKKLISPITVIGVIRNPNAAHVTCTPAFEGGDVQRFFIEVLFSTLYHCFLQATEKTVMDCTFEFSYPAPEYENEYYKLLNNNVRFNTHRHQITCHPSLLDTPLTSSNPAIIHEIKSRSSNLMQELGDNEGILTLISQYIRQRETRYPNIDDVAKHFHTSKSTLKRRLKELNVTYTELLKDARLDRACNYLESGELTIEDITQRLQFSEAAAFRRAFKQWTGQSPSSYRDSMKFYQQDSA